jgi:predicted PurR-regulated permease PerM
MTRDNSNLKGDALDAALNNQPWSTAGAARARPADVPFALPVAFKFEFQYHDAPAHLPDPVRGECLTGFIERAGLAVLALIAASLVVWLAMPVGVGLLIGTLTAFALEPFQQRLAARWRRPELAAAVCVAATTLLFTVTLGYLGYLLVTRGVVLARAGQEAFAPGGQARETADRLAQHLGMPELTPETITTWIGEVAGEVAKRAAEIAGALASVSANLLLGLFFAVMAMHFILRRWRATTVRMEAILPLDPRHTRALFEEFRHAGRAVLLGTVLTGLAQGALAGLGYWITGVPQPAFFGALTAVASLIPAVGTLLIWVPAGAYLMLTGHFTAGVVALVWGALVVVGVSDYVIRPRLVGDPEDMPALLTFVALFGGLELMGLPGLIVGPVLMSLALAALRIYEGEAMLRERPPP